MEPFRPWVDRIAYQLADQGILEINRDTKKALLSLLSKKVLWDGKSMPLMVSCHYLTAHLKRTFEDRTLKMKYPAPDGAITC